MKLNYELTKDDFLAFNLQYLKNSPTAKRMLRIQRLLVPIIFLMVPLVYWMITGEFLPGLFVTFFIVFIVWIAFYPKYFFWYTMRNVNKVLNEGENKNLLGPHEFITTDDGFIEKSQGEERKVSWSSIERVEENEKYYFLFFSSISGYIIPKRSFPDKASETKFRRLLSEKGFKRKIDNGQQE